MKYLIHSSPNSPYTMSTKTGSSCFSVETLFDSLSCTFTANARKPSKKSPKKQSNKPTHHGQGGAKAVSKKSTCQGQGGRSKAVAANACQPSKKPAHHGQGGAKAVSKKSTCQGQGGRSKVVAANARQPSKKPAHHGQGGRSKAVSKKSTHQGQGNYPRSPPTKAKVSDRANSRQPSKKPTYHASSSKADTRHWSAKHDVDIKSYENYNVCASNAIVKHIVGTSKDHYKIAGLKQKYKVLSGDNTEKCCAVDSNGHKCTGKYEATAHVKMVAIGKKGSWVLVPTCHKHNPKSNALMTVSKGAKIVAVADVNKAFPKSKGVPKAIMTAFAREKAAKASGNAEPINPFVRQYRVLNDRGGRVNYDGSDDQRCAANWGADDFNAAGGRICLDGSDDQRYAANWGADDFNDDGGRVNCDGSDDQRYAANWDADDFNDDGGRICLDGTPDMRYAANW